MVLKRRGINDLPSSFLQILHASSREGKIYELLKKLAYNDNTDTPTHTPTPLVHAHFFTMLPYRSLYTEMNINTQCQIFLDNEWT